jgi:pimeloyl-ACP methyl ester carboxylesterase
VNEEFDTDLAVRRHGRRPDEAPTMVLVHGLTDSGQGWAGAVEHWQDTYSILTLDQRGHGESPRFTDEQLDEQQDTHPGDVMVDDLIAILEQLGSAPVLVGHSLGAAVALATAVRRPDLTRALVLEDPAALAEGEEQRSPEHGQGIVASLEESLAAQSDDELAAVRKRQHPGWPDSELLPTGRAEQQVDRGYLAVGDLKPSQRLPELAKELMMPALLVTGDQDDVCVDDATRRVIEDVANPNLQVVQVPGAGHCVRRDQPDRFYELVDEWLATH